MIDEDALNVWYDNRAVGYLWRDSLQRLGFRYDSGWLEDGFRLSVQLPLQAEPFSPADGRAHFFFTNLLPEGPARERLLRTRLISDNDFTLLREFGGDCAGALSILPVEAEPSMQAGYQRLSEADLHRLVLQRGRAAYERRAGGIAPRLSLAGAQDKCPVYLHDGAYSLPIGASASTHILKFQIEGFANVPLYEAFMNRLARAVGLPVAETRLASVRDERFLVVRRYDRDWIGGRLQRLHQEDLFQALGAAHFRDKYEAEGGPAFPDCAQLVREVSEDPVKDLQALVRWQVFNVLAGNSDGHAKNLALVQAGLGSQAWRLAPFYDLVCTRAIEGVDARLAMSVGGEHDPHRISREHWTAMARSGALPEKLVLRVLDDMSEGIARQLQPAIEGFEEEFGASPALQRVERVIRRQLRVCR